MRWQFGVLVPPAWAVTGGEHSVQRTECLLEPRDGDRLHAELRFLHVRRRTVEQLGPDGAYTEVPELELADRVVVPWDEGAEERVLIHAPLVELTEDQAHARAVRFDLPPATAVRTGAGRGRHHAGPARPAPGAADRRTAPADRGIARPLPGLAAHGDRAQHHRGRGPGSGGREAALAHSMIGAHLLLGVPGGRSSHDGSARMGPAVVAGCSTTTPGRCWRDGPAPRTSCSPRRSFWRTTPPRRREPGTPLRRHRDRRDPLPAHGRPHRAGEARGPRHGRRAAEVIDLVDDMPEAVRERLHGAIRGTARDHGEEPPGGRPPGGQRAEPARRRRAPLVGPGAGRRRHGRSRTA